VCGVAGNVLNYDEQDVCACVQVLLFGRVLAKLTPSGHPSDVFVVSFPSSHSTRTSVEKPTIELKLDLHARSRLHTWAQVSSLLTLNALYIIFFTHVRDDSLRILDI
jgi:hypothetical protein